MESDCLVGIVIVLGTGQSWVRIPERTRFVSSPKRTDRLLDPHRLPFMETLFFS